MKLVGLTMLLGVASASVGELASGFDTVRTWKISNDYATSRCEPPCCRLYPRKLFLDLLNIGFYFQVTSEHEVIFLPPLTKEPQYSEGLAYARRWFKEPHAPTRGCRWCMILKYEDAKDIYNEYLSSRGTGGLSPEQKALFVRSLVFQFVKGATETWTKPRRGPGSDVENLLGV